MKKFYYDPTKFTTYLDQLGIKYPTLRAVVTHSRADSRTGRVSETAASARRVIRELTGLTSHIAMLTDARVVRCTVFNANGPPRVAESREQRSISSGVL